MSRYKLYASSRKTWVAMRGEIERAERSVYLEMYIMVDDVLGAEFVELLGRKAREGVSVKLVLDSFGSFALSNAAIGRLRASGVEVRFFSRWLHRLHRKLLIVDERVAITGGVNIHSGAESWADLALRVSGTKAVRTALGLFAKTYFMSGGADPKMRPFLRHALFERKSAKFLRSDPGEPKRALKILYRQKLFGATSSIRLVTPYFAPDRWLVAALDAAALRGVEVEIFVPRKCDSWFMDRVNHFYILKMSKTNVSFFLYPTMNHAKVLLIDEREALVGSQNLDALSFNRNIESGVLVGDPALVREIAGVIETWRGESAAFPNGAYRRRWYDYILAPVIRLFQPFL